MFLLKNYLKQFRKTLSENGFDFSDPKNPPKNNFGAILMTCYLNLLTIRPKLSVPGYASLSHTLPLISLSGISHTSTRHP